jgi:hypothetical protein
MQTGIISFGDRVAWNIKCNKDAILDELSTLYNVRIIQKHYFNIDDNNIKYLSKIPHLISLRSNGNRYYIYFTLYNDVEIIYYIDMKIHTGYEKPRIILARGLFDKSLFKNTLLDGEMVKTNDNKWVFIINDIIAYEGKKLDDVILPERLKIIYKILETKYTPDEIIDVCTYKVKNYYNLSKKSIEELLQFSKELNYTSRGLYFSSYYLKHKPKLLNFNNDMIISVHKKIKDNAVFKELQTKKETSPILPSPSILPSPQSLSILPSPQSLSILPLPLPSSLPSVTSNLELWVSKTDEPDIYNIYDNHNIMTSNKLGIAFIASMQDSNKMRNIFKDKSTTLTIKFRCNYNEKFKKYQPIQQIV